MMLRLAVALLLASSGSSLAATAKASFQVGLIITAKHAGSTDKPKPLDSQLTGERALRSSLPIVTKPIRAN